MTPLNDKQVPQSANQFSPAGHEDFNSHPLSKQARWKMAFQTVFTGKLAWFYFDIMDIIEIIGQEEEMFPALLLALREGLEITLVIGIVLGSLNRLKHNELKPILWYGAGSAIIVSLLIAITLNLLGAEFEGTGEQIFEGTAMILAAALLSWMIFWMRRENTSFRETIESGVAKATAQQGKLELFLLSFSSVLREGIELVLFLLAARYTAAPIQTWSGALIGLIISAALGWGFFVSSVRLNLNRFFLVTNLLLIVFAAGLFGRAIHEFNEAAIIPAGIESMYNLSSILAEDSPVGQLLTALVGYSSAPSLTMMIGYFAYLLVIISAFRIPGKLISSKAT